MSSVQTKSPDFLHTAMDLGWGLMGVAFAESEPHRLAKAYEQRLAFAAKYLAKATGLKRAHAYEALAKSAGFANWHHFSEHLKVAVEGSGNLGQPWSAALSASLPLLTEVNESLPITPVAKVHLEAFWAKVAVETGTDAAHILDSVGAPMLGEKSWGGFAQRSPVDAKEAFYRFTVGEGGRSGRFRTSAACSALVDQLDSVYQGYGDFPKREQTKAKKAVREMVGKRPDFLEGQLALADLLYRERSPDAETVLDGALSKAEALIPDGFDGRIIWGETDNRFYHRLLWLRFEIDRNARRGADAEAGARKMLRLNPNDNLGLRFALPLVLVSTGRYVEADEACEALREPDAGTEGVPAAILALVSFVNGREEEFRRKLLRALFTWPPLRLILHPSIENLHSHADDTRVMAYSLDEFSASATPAITATPDLRRACLSLIGRREVVAAEDELRRMWRGFWQVDEPRAVTSSLEEWQERVEHHVNSLSR